jgi:hypothetical protein
VECGNIYAHVKRNIRRHDVFNINVTKHP